MNPEIVSSMIWLGAKIFVLLAILVYTVFAGIMVRQEHLMANVLEEGFEPFLRIVTILHFIASLVLFVLSIILL